MDQHYFTLPGNPQPLGAIRTPEGINFALFARHAEKVALVIGPADEHGQEPSVEIQLDEYINKTGNVWHVLVRDLPESFAYGYRIGGPNEPAGSGHRYDAELVLIDPYAKMLCSTAWGEEKKLFGKRPCCLVPARGYDWQGDRPLNRPLKDTIIYELHVRGFTNHASSGVKHRGLYAGIVEKIDYLKELGITAVELMPVMEFDENDAVFFNPLTGQGLRNYWGYAPVSFFAPKSAYSTGCGRQLDEFRDMVKALHRAGIEVILDIVFNHTAEGGANGPTTSFRGIDNTIYYLLDPLTRDYLNFSGCGNTCNCNHPIMRSLIMDVLRWWVVEMHVDGFRFDLASILGRDQQGHVLSNPPVVEQIAEDPVLANSKIIAEAWDAAGLYQVGSFSAHRRWAEWNGKFRDDVRAFMRGDEGQVPHLATRIAGSSDLYQSGGRQPCNSINFITSHDGFTLMDLVSYDTKHNQENGENNQDGENHNLSWNSGVEGESDDPRIKRLRLRRIKTMAVILFLSQGVPMLVAGDEFGRSQWGNNNAYCQDNEISWLNWNLLTTNTELFRFFRRLIALRSEHHIFRRDEFFIARRPDEDPLHKHEIIWQGRKPGMPDWSRENRSLGFVLNGSALPDIADDDFFVALNGHREASAIFTMPRPPAPHGGRCWKQIIDTNAPAPHDIIDPRNGRGVVGGDRVVVAPMGCVVLQSA